MAPSAAPSWISCCCGTVRRWGFEFKCTDAPRTTRSMHVAIEDLGLGHLWVIYPGDLEYPLTDTITALPLKNIHDIALRAKR